jgi:hypothetical protein
LKGFFKEAAPVEGSNDHRYHESSIPEAIRRLSALPIFVQSIFIVSRLTENDTTNQGMRELCAPGCAYGLCDDCPKANEARRSRASGMKREEGRHMW